MDTDFDTFVTRAWADHAVRPDEVGERVAAALHLARTPAQLQRVAGLVVHVFGEHLGQWARGAQLLASLRDGAAYDASPAAEGPIARGIAALGIAGGDDAAGGGLAAEDRVAALAVASSALLGRHEVDRAMSLYAQATSLAEPLSLAQQSPAVRALAVGGNNLAAELEDKADRSGIETVAMVRCAEAALKYWQLCGAWLEHERAEYRLARSLLRAGLAIDALAHAQRCVQICTEHDAPACERFFGHAVVALVQRSLGNHSAFDAARARALAAHAEVPADEQAWCAGDLAELRG